MTEPMKNLEEGDVIKLVRGMRVYAEIPRKIAFSNPFSEGVTSSEVVVGTTLEVTKKDFNSALDEVVGHVMNELNVHQEMNVPREDVTKFVEQYAGQMGGESFVLDAGEYVVVKTTFDGGSTGGGMNGHDDYPDGHHVICKALNSDGSYNPNGVEASFYQSGCFTCMLPDIEPVRKMEMKFV